MRELRTQGLSYPAIARALNISEGTAWNYANKYEMDTVFAKSLHHSCVFGPRFAITRVQEADQHNRLLQIRGFNA
ncbi:MAG: hypothetical protein IAE80_15410 [Anaerolinea sp.]|nr:hypothetical protein [Anaerolinea sp.]